MDYADFNAAKASKKKLTALVIVLALAIALTLLSKVVLEPKYEELKVSLESTSALARQITSAETEKDGYEQTLENSGKVFGNLVSDKESYISFIGETTLANQLKVNKMTVDDIVPAGSQLYAMKISLEVQGSLYNVKNLIQNLYDSEVVSRINSFSYRLQSVDKDGNQLQWMWRNIDDENLVPWWTLTDEDDKSTTNNEEETPLGANDLLEHGTALCYLEIEFLGTGG